VLAEEGGDPDAISWAWEEDADAADAGRNTVDAANPAPEQADLLAQNIDDLVEEALIEEIAAGAVDDVEVSDEAAPAAEPAEDAAADSDKSAELEAKLAAAEADKAKLEGELGELKQQVEELSARPAKSSPAPGSDLFSALQKENAELKQRLTTAEGECLAAVEKCRELEEAVRKAEEEVDELAKARAEDSKEQEDLKDLVGHVPKMEEELQMLRSELAKKEKILKERERALQAMAVELQKREHRLIKAERMSEMIEKARADLKQVNAREERDMHYNMAAVYTREGRFQDAEREYLRALRVDPADADSHYNLGILYDEHLDQPRKATMHYQRYLRLRPHARDVDEVKKWLLALDLGVRP